MRKILLATDGSEYSQHAARLLARLPHPGKIDVIVASVVNTPRVYSDGSQSLWLKDYLKEREDEAARSFREVQELFDGANADLTHVVTHGGVGATIVELAQQQKVDLVVVGARGHSNIERILLGSVSDYVATHAHCSVLVVRPNESSSDDQLRIAVGYDDTGPAQAAIEEFAEVQWGAQSTVEVISVIQPISRPASGRGDDPEAERREAERARLSDAIERVAAELKHCCVQIHTQIIDHRHAGEGIVKFAEQNACNLLVVGETPRNVIGRLLMGSVSRYVLRHAPCSVWITRNRTIEARRKHADQSAQAT